MKAYLFEPDGKFIIAYEGHIAYLVAMAFMRNPIFYCVCICAHSMKEAMSLFDKYCNRLT